MPDENMTHHYYLTAESGKTLPGSTRPARCSVATQGMTRVDMFMMKFDLFTAMYSGVFSMYSGLFLPWTPASLAVVRLAIIKRG
jgi:hypothetical protein